MAWLEETGSGSKENEGRLTVCLRHVPKHDCCSLFYTPNSTQSARPVAEKSVSVVPAYPKKSETTLCCILLARNEEEGIKVGSIFVDREISSGNEETSVGRVRNTPQLSEGIATL